MQFDFSAWAELAQRDPAAFEARRQEMLEAALASIPENRRERMRQLQARIEQLRSAAPTPLAACDSIAELMWESVAGDDGLIASLGRVKRHLLKTQQTLPPDNVIPMFPKRSKSSPADR
jgi:hypothetical protein